MKSLKNDIVYISKKTLDLGLNNGSEGNVNVNKFFMIKKSMIGRLDETMTR